MAPTILFVPGFWEGPAPFAEVSSLLQSAGFSTRTAELLSTGTVSPGNPGMHDDIAALRSTITELVDAQKDVVIVAHSGGAFLASNAIEGLGAKARLQQGMKGGVVKLVFLAGALFPEGFKHSPLPFFTIDGGAMHCITPEKTLFNDLDDAATQKWTEALKPQPAEGWDDTITYCGWKEVPSVYLVCEKDQVIPPPMQTQIGEMAGCKMESCDAGHMAILSVPEKVAEVVKSAVHAT